MKHIRPAILSLATACAVLAGCSKTKEVKAPASTEAPVAPAAAAPAIATKEPLEMKIKWVVGKTYIFRSEVNQESSAVVPGMPQPMKQVSKSSQDYSVSPLKELPDGGHELELVFLGQAIEAKMSDRIMLSFDSKLDASKDGDNPMAPALRKIIGIRVTLFTDSSNRVQKVAGLNEVLDRLTTGETPQIQSMYKGILSEDNLKQLCAFGETLPDHAVKAGDNWTMNREVPAKPIGMINLKLNSTFKGWEQHEGRNCALLEFTGDLSSKPSTVRGPMTATLDKGRISGKNWFDPALGMLAGNSTEQTMSLKVNLQGKSMSPLMTQQATMKLLAVKDAGK